MALIYNLGQNDEKNFIIGEDSFDKQNLGKCETIMAQGNGYLGLRNSLEERYVNQTRGCFIAGTFNKFDENEVTELPNAADVVGIDMILDGQSLEDLLLIDYERHLNLKTGLSHRKIQVMNSKSKRYTLSFERIISFDNVHLIAQRVSITPLDDDCIFKFSTGIDGQMTNSSVQHFSEGQKRLYENDYMESIFTTTQSKIHFIFHSYIKTDDVPKDKQIQMDRRKIFMNYSTTVKKNQCFTFEKFSSIHTSRDIEFTDTPLEEIKYQCLERIKSLDKNFKNQLKKSTSALYEKYWKDCNVEIRSKNNFDELAIKFSIYHLAIMTPYDDSRMSIAAKGLTGEGYKGHVFWDCEVFCLPFFLHEKPDVARKLLEYRYHTLPGARKKANLAKFRGTQYPWESAWIDDGETTPVWGAADIVTGKPIKIESGFIQLHITSIVANAVKQYYESTDDLDFMIKYGFQIIFETAEFWCSRLDYNEKKDRYELNDVMGPDEYKEHINNDAFTNYMAKYNLQLALEYYDLFKQSSFKNYDDLINEISEKIDKIYLPKPDENLIIPQNDTYLSLNDIDLTKYKNSSQVGDIFKDYNLDQINKIQVSKQADVLLLFILFEKDFTKEVILKNFDYYEKRTLHDSSLSLSIHCILARKMKHMDLAYDLFKRACEIDLGQNMKSSDHGVHAASIGGIWNCAILGFGGINQNGDVLLVEPKLPDEWESLKFGFMFKGSKLEFEIYQNMVKITNKSDEKIKVQSFGSDYELINELKININ